MRRLLPILCTLICVLPTICLAAPTTPHWVVATQPTPVFNTPDTKEAMRGGRFVDRCGLNRALEFIALPGAAFRVEGELRRDGEAVYRVTTADYPYPAKEGLFVDARFVKDEQTRPPERSRSLPGRDKIARRMLSAVGLPYVWGGNVREGILPPGERGGKAVFAGLDCSGLLYEATDGVTPRNTSSLVSFGRPVPVAGLTPDAIAARLQPLDLIVWRGHVIIVLDRKRTIESRLSCNSEGKSGVVVSPLRERLREVMTTRQPADAAGKDTFVVRRWFETSRPAPASPSPPSPPPAAGPPASGNGRAASGR